MNALQSILQTRTPPHAVRKEEGIPFEDAASILNGEGAGRVSKNKSTSIMDAALAFGVDPSPYLSSKRLQLVQVDEIRLRAIAGLAHLVPRFLPLVRILESTAGAALSFDTTLLRSLPKRAADIGNAKTGWYRIVLDDIVDEDYQDALTVAKGMGLTPMQLSLTTAATDVVLGATPQRSFVTATRAFTGEQLVIAPHKGRACIHLAEPGKHYRKACELIQFH